MKVERHLLPIMALSTFASALVVPELKREQRDAANTLKLNAKELGEDISSFLARDGNSKVPESNESSRDVAVEAAKELGEKGQSPLYSAAGNGGQDIPYKYIVVFKKGVGKDDIVFHHEEISSAHVEAVSKLSHNHEFFAAAEESRSLRKRGEGSANDKSHTTLELPGGIEELFQISDDVQGYFGYFTDELVEIIRRSELVDFVERDSVVEVTEGALQTAAPWGLARVSHRERLSVGTFNKYLYDDTAGEGVTAYVIDTGINIDHQDFEGRADWGRTMPSNDADYDGNGHGTHCAGTIGSKTYGVAKKTKLVAVKVLRSNGSGSNSDVLRGVQYVLEQHREAVRQGKPGFKGSVANMSLGGARTRALDMAVDAAVDGGVHFAVAAGNENQDACYSSPAASKNAITVAASNLADEKAYFSNWGVCVDLFAPGTNILSTYVGSDTATAILSGTSMASPHVAGLLSYFLSLQPGSDSQFHVQGGVSPNELKRKILAFSSKNILSSVSRDTPNLLVFNGAGGNLDAFWGESYSQPSGNAVASGPFRPIRAEDLRTSFRLDLGETIREVQKSLELTTDGVYNEIKNILDRMNII